MDQTGQLAFCIRGMSSVRYFRVPYRENTQKYKDTGLVTVASINVIGGQGWLVN